MEYYAKIIHKTHINYLPTNYPVHFYGMPNGKVFFVYARNSGIKCKTEYVFAEHKEFYYDYSTFKLLWYKQGKMKIAINNELIDKPDPDFNIFKVSNEIHSYTAAFDELNQMARKIINEENDKETILLDYKPIEKLENIRNNVG